MVGSAVHRKWRSSFSDWLVVPLHSVTVRSAALTGEAKKIDMYFKSFVQAIIWATALLSCHTCQGFEEDFRRSSQLGSIHVAQEGRNPYEYLPSGNRYETPDYAIQSTLVGGTGGEYGFAEDYRKGGVLSEIQVWVGPFDLRMLSLVFTSGNKVSFGDPGNITDPVQFKFEPGERVTELALWDNNQLERDNLVTGLLLVTDKNRNFNAGTKDRGFRRNFTGSGAIGSGLITRVEARSGASINALGFEFLRTIESARVQVTEYPFLSKADLKGRLRVLGNFVYNNTDSDDATIILNGLPILTERYAWSSPFGSALSVEAKVPFVKDEGGKPVWGLSSSSKWETENLVDKRMDYASHFDLPPQSHVSAEITVTENSITLGYVGAFEVKTVNNAVWRFTGASLYSGVTYHSVRVEAK